MYSDNDFRLYHHGILGQRKGVQNGPPYPLDASDHSASEQKAGWRKSLASTIGNIRRKQQERKEANQIRKTQAAEKKAQEEKEAAEKKAQEEKEAAEKRVQEEKEAAEKRVQEEKEAAEKEKRELINSGDQEAIGKAAKEGRLTIQEFNEAVQRCELNKRLENSKPQEQTVNKMKNASDKLKDFSNLAKNGTELYNSVADIINAISPDAKLRKIDSNLFKEAREADEKAQRQERDLYLREVMRSGDEKRKSEALKDMTNEEVKSFSERLGNEDKILGKNEGKKKNK